MFIQGIGYAYHHYIEYDIHKEIYNFRSHIHHFIELTLVLEGELNVTVNGKVETAKNGQFIFILPFQKHEYSSNTQTHFVIYTFPVSLISDFIRNTSGMLGERTVFDSSPLTLELFKERLMYEPKLDIYNVRSCLYAMLGDFTSQVNMVEASLDNHVVNKLVYYVEKHFNEPLPLNEVARTIGYTPNYLSHCISKSLGLTYSAFLGSVRTEHAKYMLLESNQNILDVAHECGYPNVRSFQRNFKSLTGLSPAEFRNRGVRNTPSFDESEAPPNVIRKKSFL